jgi:SPOR domain
VAYHVGPIAPEQQTEFPTDPDDEESPARSHRVIGAILALLVMALFAGGLWFAYLKGTRSAGTGVANVDVPLIRADQRPTKVKPEHPGGMEIPDKDNLIYNPSHPQIEHLLPPPEKPLPRPTAPLPQVVASAPATTAPATPPGQTGPITPAPPSPMASASPPTSSVPGTAGQPQQSVVAPPGSGASGLSKPLPGQAAAGTAGPRLQLGSVRSQDGARQEWERIKRKNPDLLGSLSATPVRADLGEKGVFYRIQTAPVADPAIAERLCSELKQRNIGCIIAR